MRHCMNSVNGEQIILVNQDKFSTAVLHADVSKGTGIHVLCVLCRVAFFPGVV